MNSGLLRCFLLAAALAAGCSREDEPARALPGERESRVASRDEGDAAELEIPDGSPTVAFLGDSITAGLHLPASQAFPAVLQVELAREGHPFELINAGVSGDTSAGGLRRVEWLLSRKPDIVVIELGANDGLRGQDLASVETNLRAIVRKVKDAGAKPLLVGMLLPPSYGGEYTSGFEQLYARIAADEGIAFVARFMADVAGRAEFMLEDDLHPSAAGHRKLAEAIRPKLHELLDAGAE
jgi:acyl-CoA thioesterase-1